MKKIFDIIKSLFNIKNKNISDQHLNKIEEKLSELLSSVNVGDIIWAKRYSNEILKNTILEGHREGPYIVLGKNDKGLICSRGSGVSKKDDRYLIFDMGEYSFHKDTYFKLYDLRIIDDYKFIRGIGKLDKTDIDMFFKEIKSVIKSYKYKNSKFSFYLPIQIGDIILNSDKKYLVLDIENNKLNCIEVNKKITFDTELNNNYFLDLDYSNIISLDYDYNNIRYLNSVINKILINILNKQKQYLNYLDRKSIIQRGSLVRYNNNFFYVYGEDGQNYLLFEINSYGDVKSDIITINKNIYYTNYKTIKLNKFVELKNVDLALDEEINSIIKAKRIYTKNNKRKLDSIVKEYNSKKFNFGDIIKSNGDLTNYYIAIKCDDKYVYCISEFSVNEKYPKIHNFNIDEVSVIDKTKNKKVYNKENYFNFIVDTVKVKRKTN